MIVELAPSPLGAYRFADPANPSDAVGHIQDNDYKIIEAAISFNSQGIAKDDGSGNYTGPHWLDKNGDGDAEDEGESKNPTSHVRGTPTSESKVIATVDFNTEGDLKGEYQIKGVGTGPGSPVFEGKATIEGSHLKATLTPTQKLPDLIDLSNLNIAWTITRKQDGMEWGKNYGQSSNRIYVTGAAAANAFETVLDVGCRNAAGLRPAEAGELDPGASGANQQVINAIWDEFADRSVKRVDGTKLTFWGDVVKAIGIGSASQLLAADHGHGSCGAWADLLVKTLQAQGISGAYVANIHADQAVVRPMLGNPNPPAGWGVGIIARINPNLPAQGNLNPKNDFIAVFDPPGGNSEAIGAHVVVKVTGLNSIFSDKIIYDPSYGEKYEGVASMAEAEQAWEENALQGWQYRYYQPISLGGANQDGNLVSHQSPPAPRETFFDP